MGRGGGTGDGGERGRERELLSDPVRRERGWSGRDLPISVDLTYLDDDFFFFFLGGGKKGKKEKKKSRPDRRGWRGSSPDLLSVELLSESSS